LKFIDSGCHKSDNDEPPAFITGKLRQSEHDELLCAAWNLIHRLACPNIVYWNCYFANAGRICTRDHVIETVWPEAMGEAWSVPERLTHSSGGYVTD